MAVTSLGIGSGIDLESLVVAYIDAEAIPQEIRLQEKEERLNLELSGVGSFKSALSSFNDILTKLSDIDAFNKQVTASDSSAVEVKTNGFASNGSFEIDVEQLAQGSRRQSTLQGASTDILGAGTLTFSAGSETFDVTIGASDTLSDIRDSINAQAENFGVTANIINTDAGTYLVYNSEVSGDVNNLTVSSTGSAALNNISSLSTQGVDDVAQDARVYVDGNLITSDTNEFNNSIEDITFTVSEVTTVGSPATISVSQDSEYGNELIDEFISGYNALVDNLTGLAAPKQGRLAFDPNVRQVKQDLVNTVIETVSGVSGSFSALSDIGLELDRNGNLRKSTFSSANISSGQEKLDYALENKLPDLGELFASSNGIATQMSNMIDGYISSDGVLTQRQNTLNERVSGIADEYANLEDRLRSYEETLRKQFTYLDSTISQYNATSSYLTGVLAGLTPKSDD